jgi:tetratricopeptide (TPR) repeat protein
MRSPAVAACAVALLLWTGLARADAGTEEKARQSFTAGKYPDALLLYEKLYLDTGHPTYLRNVGRCYQMLKDPERAITAFREYLRISEDLQASARADVEGFIREMEDLQRRQREEAAAASPAPRPLPAVRPPAADHPGATFERTSALQGAPDRSDEKSHTWIWIAGGAVAVAAAAVASVFLLRRDPQSPCPECTLPTVRVDTR